MCGIGGWFAWGTRRPSVGTLRGILYANQSRGQDAAGIAYLSPEGNSIKVTKQKGKAENLISAITDAEWAGIASSPRGLLHARAKTKGDVSNNANNHPVFGYGWVAVHNGHIRNDDDLFEYYGDERVAEVDSSAIPLVLSKGANYLESVQQLSILAGDVTTAVWGGKKLDQMALVRLGGNDLFLMLDQDILYWSSTLLATAALPSTALGKMKFFNLAHLQDGRVMILTPDRADIKTFKMDRRPYWIPMYCKKNTVKPEDKKSGNSQAPKTETSIIANTGGVLSEGPVKPRRSAFGATFSSDKLFWESVELGEFKLKPSPLFTKDFPLAWNTYWITRVSSSMTPLATDDIRVVPTVYGNWMFRRKEDDEATMASRLFYAHKRVKRWWETTFPEEVEKLKNLPMRFEKAVVIKSQFDNRLFIENFILKEKEFVDKADGGYIERQRPGFMCPWCGVYGRTDDWISAELRCWFCRIKSKLQT